MNVSWSECVELGGRDQQEDAVGARGAVGVVADGMGGHANGAAASEAAVAAVLEELHVGGDFDDLVSAFHYAADRVADTGGGTTLTVALVDGDRARVAWVGDSRAYLVRDGVVACVTDDHVGPDGGLSRWLPDEASPSTVVLPLRPGDHLVLCTDGVWGPLDEHDDALGTVVEADAPAEWVVELALDEGTADNCGAVVCRVRG